MFWPILHVSFLNYIIASLSLSLTCAFKKIVFSLYICEQLETEWNSIHSMECFELSIFGWVLKCNRGCRGGTLFWKSGTHLHPYCILCQGFRKVKHSHWVHIIDRGHSSLQTKILDDIYSWTGTISTVK